MKRLQLLMGMPINVEILDANAPEADIERVFAYFRSIDETFSNYKEESEISKINRGELAEEASSDAVKTILALGEQTRQETQGYFDIEHDGLIDPSGIVKGWAIFQAAQMLKEAGCVNFYIIYFLEQLPGFEGYMIDSSARATYTSNFERYILKYEKPT